MIHIFHKENHLIKQSEQRLLFFRIFYSLFNEVNPKTFLKGDKNMKNFMAFIGCGFVFLLWTGLSFAVGAAWYEDRLDRNTVLRRSEKQTKKSYEEKAEYSCKRCIGFEY